MMLTQKNLNEVIFENEDARLLILDVVSRTQASLYYYHDQEVSVSNALRIWQKAMEAEEADSMYRVSFFSSDLLQNDNKRRTVQVAS